MSALIAILVIYIVLRSRFLLALILLGLCLSAGH